MADISALARKNLAMGNKSPERLAVKRTAKWRFRRTFFPALKDTRHNAVRLRNTQLAFLTQRANKQSANGPHSRIWVDAHRLTGRLTQRTASSPLICPTLPDLRAPRVRMAATARRRFGRSCKSDHRSERDSLFGKSTPLHSMACSIESGGGSPTQYRRRTGGR